MRPFQTLSARDNFFCFFLHREIVLGETQLYIFNILQNFLNTAGITLFSMSTKSTIDYIFSQEFQISFRLFEAKFIPRVYVKGKFSKEIWKGTRSNVLT